MKLSHAIFLLAAILLLGATPVLAQGASTAGDNPLTLVQVTSMALAASPSVRASEENMAQAQARLGQAQAQRRFQIIFNSTAGVSNGDIYQAPPAHETFGALQNTLTVPLPINPKFAALEAQARSQYEAAVSQIQAARLAAAAAAQSAYFDLLKQQALLKTAQLNENQAQQQVDAAKKRFAAGATPNLDILKAQVPLIAAQAAVVQAQTAVQSTTQALNYQLQHGFDEPLQIADIGSAEPITLTLTLQEARDQAVAHSATIEAAQANVGAAQAAQRAAKQGRAPDLALQASDARSKDLTGFSRLDTLQLSVTLPLSDGGQVREQIQEAQAALDGANTALLQAQQAAALSAGEAYLTAQGALAQVQPTQEAVDIAQTVLQRTMEGYLVGLNPIIDVLSAQAALNQARIAHVQAVYDAASAVAALHRALGEVAPA